jgi:hypothetical protein
MLLGVHVRAVGMEKKWHGPEGMERIGGLYDPTRDVNNTSTSILQDSLRGSIGGGGGGATHEVSEADMLDRSVVLHSPRSSLGSSNVRYSRTAETQQDPMHEKVVDLGFYASETRGGAEWDAVAQESRLADPVGNVGGRGARSEHGHDQFEDQSAGEWTTQCSIHTSTRTIPAGWRKPRTSLELSRSSGAQCLGPEPHEYRRFADGWRTNACDNMLDQHVDDGCGERVALIYDSAVTDTKRRITYATMREVSRLAGALCSRCIGG